MKHETFGDRGDVVLMMVLGERLLIFVALLVLIYQFIYLCRYLVGFRRRSLIIMSTAFLLFSSSFLVVVVVDVLLFFSFLLSSSSTLNPRVTNDEPCHLMQNSGVSKTCIN